MKEDLNIKLRIRGLRMGFTFLGTLFFFSPGFAQKECKTHFQVDSLFKDYQRKHLHTPQTYIQSLEEAYCVQDAFLKLYRTSFPKDQAVGYKAGFTSKGIQKKLNLKHPVYGTFFESMMLENQSYVSVESAPGLRYELDLIAVVGNEKIQNAQDPQDVLASISHLQAFIELPSFIMSPKTPQFAYHVVGGNVFARLGVLGSKIELKGSGKERFEALKSLEMKIILNGKELETQGAERLLGHPAYVIYALIKDLKSKKKSLKKGSLLSLGSVSKFYVPKVGDRVDARYTLGNQQMEATVFFEPAMAH